MIAATAISRQAALATLNTADFKRFTFPGRGNTLDRPAMLTLFRDIMAWRPDQSLIRGEIDNTQRGLVTGTLWFLGREEPVQLQLTGDAAPDLAGCRLTFVNPDPQPEAGDFSGSATLQSGQAGEITAANKRRDFNIPQEAFDESYRENRVHELPLQWSNSLYLEWFSSANGRVLIESCRYELTVGGPAWTGDADEHAAQEWLALAAMRDYLDAVVNRTDPAEANPDGTT